MADEIIENSSFLDFTAYRIAPFDDSTTVEHIYDLAHKDVGTATAANLNVAIILGRANAATDPDVAILSQDWATRQAAVADQNALWAIYGSDQKHYADVYNAIAANPDLTILDSSNSNYVTSQQSRTIWVQLDAASDFNNLFGTTLQQYTDPTAAHRDFVFWNGDLSLPEEWQVAGLWFDTTKVPEGSRLTDVDSVTLAQGAQGPGNNAGSIAPNAAPQDIATLYNFPLDGETVSTGAIGLIEPGVGSYLPGDPTGTMFQPLLAQYLASVGRSGSGTVSVQGLNGQAASAFSFERSLDVGVAAAINPNSDIVLFNGSGSNPKPGGTGFAQASIFTAAQSAIWDTTVHPAVTSNSWGVLQSMTPGSPYHEAYWQLYVDAALRNQTTFIALGDGGSGNLTSNGVTNVEYNSTQPYNILVGGTSLSTLEVARADSTLKSSLVASALAGDPSTIWQLVSGGLKGMPADMLATQFFVEAVWNEYDVEGDVIDGYGGNGSGAGGVDPTQATPSYQLDYGLAPVTSDPLHEAGRGVPDVAANSAGNLWYLVPSGDMLKNQGVGGTSAAAPLWASLGVQLNAIFADQGLPNLGYMNDLLYMASAIAPAAFNDVSLGNNISSFYFDENGPYVVDGRGATATGYGYFAGPGYDLTTGLGTPNGVLLARALTQIAHSQASFDSVPDVLERDGTHGWKSGADQTLLFQTMSPAPVLVTVDVGDHTELGFSSVGGGAFAWTSQFAQQSLQQSFDPDLVRMFDQHAQGTVAQATLAAGDTLAIGVNGGSTSAIQGNLTSGFGFADFLNTTGDVRVARPVAVAETAGGHDDQTAVVRVRQNGTDNDAVAFYRVDDFAGTIDGLAPGQAGYAAAAQARAYQLSSGGTALDGPGYGNYTEARLLDVDAGDLIAMFLVNQSSGETYWSFAQANPQAASQLWNYALNTWGWEDRRVNGDRDYNDLVVGIDFTSTAGHGWLA